jgi:polyisoprenoid-binding protein YceI
MKIFSKFFAFAVIAVAVACNNAPTETVETKEAEEVATPVEEAFTYAVETEGDEINWEGYKTYSDDVHTGTLQVQEGEFQIEGGSIVSGKFVIDMNSIVNGDIESEEYRTKLEGHLKSPDFFSTEEFPTATFALTSVEANENAEDGSTHTFKGNLMMRDQEKNITFPVKVTMDGDNVMISTPEFVIDRTQWGVEFHSSGVTGLAKDQLIDDNIKLKINLSAKKA